MLKMRQLTVLFLLILTLPFLQAQQTLSDNPKLTVSVIDVGQGDSILIQFPDSESMLIDAGTRDAGSIVVGYLHSRQVSKIDILVASHPHEDHIGGMTGVLANFTVGKVWDSGYVHGSKTQERFLQTIQDKGIRYGKPKAGFSQSIGQVRIDVLAPVRPLAGTNSDPNNNSIVMRVSYGKISFLFTGDMEAEERASVGSFPKTTVLKVAHHGSRNGTDSRFVSQVAPKIAAISYGRGNSYGHPHAEALSALKAAGVKIYGTGDNGTVIVSTDGKTILVKTLGSSGQVASGNEKSYSESGQQKSNGGGEGGYIGNRNSHIFHRPSCHSLPAEKNRIYFKTREEAVAAGYRPCKRCKP
jgi:competence protein ComEC